ncbi:hypothetical protein [Alteromonas sp. V450]|uniref:hypothetical protein n=1 Tax=Alteromonas sp. V450 TaxID=1912139 RepID=UPI0008FF5DDD|nr:hypothetical protein [Alteromonas sp. V450]
MRNNLNLDDRIKGMATIPIVCILLFTLSFVCFSSVERVNTYFLIERSSRVNEEDKIYTQLAIKSLASLLVRHSIGDAMDKAKHPALRFTVDEKHFVAKRGQAVKQYDITATFDNRITYVSRFLKYPALLRLPDKSNLNKPDPFITELLFNRAIADLSPSFFPQLTTSRNCESLAPKTIYWIEGSCTLTKIDVEHSSTKNPILMIVNNGDVTLSKNVNFFGLIVVLSRANNVELNIHKDAKLHGAFLSNLPIKTHVSGTIVHSNETLYNLQHSNALAKIILVPGSWYNKEK